MNSLSRLNTTLAASLLCAVMLPDPAIGQTDYSQDADQIRSQIEALESESSSIREKRDRFLKELASIDQKASEIERKRRTAIADLQKEDLSKQDSRRAKYLQVLELEQRTVALNSTMPTYLGVSSQDNLTFAVRDNDINRLSRSRAYLNYLTRSQVNHMEAIYNLLGNTTVSDDNSDIAKLVLYTDDLKQQLADGKKSKLSIERQVESLNRQLVSNQTTIRQLHEQFNKVRSLSAAADDVSETTDGTQVQSTQFKAPIDATVRRKFGDPKKAYGRRWSGLLYQTDSGQTVRAAASGVVIFAKEHKTLGHLIIIDHGNELVTLYAHNDQLLVGLGDLVVAQQSIAHAGTTGDVTSPSLYFEIRDSGEPVDPLLYLGG